MSILRIDGYKLRRFIINGTNSLLENKDTIDALNVFPVPDGDTGTNMSLTALAAANEVAKVNSPNISEVANAAAKGSLRGARGNSGVILSQIFRGFAKALEGKAVAEAEDLALAFSKATETAYKAVMKPKEGTILTVIKAVSERAVEYSYESDSIDMLLLEALNAGKEMLEKTPDMLPQLKQAGVVDAGGKGFLTILEGGIIALDKRSEVNDFTKQGATSNPMMTGVASTEDVEIKFGYCTEFFVQNENSDEDTVDSLTEFLDKIGDSIVVVSDDEIIKIHVHTNNPGQVLERALKIGQLENIKIENMRLQHTSVISFAKEGAKESPKPKEKKKYGFISVCAGEGFKSIFEELGVDYVIEGGQTMNPSTEDFMAAFDKINAENIFVLPNNKNIIMAAKQAAELCEDKRIEVIETVTVPQGIMAMVNYMPESSVEENSELMAEGIGMIATGQITYAVRDTVVDDFEIKQGDFLCMVDGKIRAVEKSLDEAARIICQKMLEDNEDASFVSIYYGQEVKEEDAQALSGYVEESFADVECELRDGGQPVYYYIISVE